MGGVTSVSQPRLLDPPRLAEFCPAVHCGRACGPEDCHCLPCRRANCCRRARRVKRGSLAPDVAPARGSQPRLFSTVSDRLNQQEVS